MVPALVATAASQLLVGDSSVSDHQRAGRLGHLERRFELPISAVLETAVWGAELATALRGLPGRGHVYVVEPTGPFEDDPNVTDKRFPGNPTASYRSNCRGGHHSSSSLVRT